MSEYWKSTPKYWCKHCQTFVKDTKLEKKSHEATGRHQGNLQRFLRGLHRDNEREERDKQRAKDEVDRLNGVKKPLSTSPALQLTAAPSHVSRNATPAERKQQLQQLADMGIAVPEDFRREAAMTGDWRTISERVMLESKAEDTGIKTEALHEESKAPLNIGVRKRKYEGEEEEKEAGETVRRKGWGSTTRSYSEAAKNDDLDDLLKGANDASAAARKVNTIKREDDTGDLNNDREPNNDDNHDPEQIKEAEQADAVPAVKGASDHSNIYTSEAGLHDQELSGVKQENDIEPQVVFKKRKAKPRSKSCGPDQ